MVLASWKLLSLPFRTANKQSQRDWNDATSGYHEVGSETSAGHNLEQPDVVARTAICR